MTTGIVRRLISMPIDGDFDALHEPTHFHKCLGCGNEFSCEDDTCADMPEVECCPDCLLGGGYEM
jgi:hypothetical protein